VLHIDANAILELMPSLFSIDSIVSAILAVAVADETTNPALGGLEITKPRPAPASRYGGPTSGARSIFNGGSTTRPGSVRSYAGSVFYATIAEREEAEEEAKLMRRTHKEDIRATKSTKSQQSRSKSKSKKTSRKWFGRSSSSSSNPDDTDSEAGTGRRGKDSKSKTKKIVMTEFDLEKLGHYQSGDRKGEELPAVTRGAIGGLCLTMLVQILTWMLVHITRGVTSEKF
jgi:hypothetical protein